MFQFVFMSSRFHGKQGQISQISVLDYTTLVPRLVVISLIMYSPLGKACVLPDSLVIWGYLSASLYSRFFTAEDHFQGRILELVGKRMTFI